jgi:polypeptide N-acetylgalactosaminyltransferase
MATRVEGARLAQSEIVVFLDSHIECTAGWLEPMIGRILEDRRNVVVPMIDSIDPDTFKFTAGGLDIVAFDWGLRQAFPKRDIVDVHPVASPGMGGGLFAINRALFFELGGYDPGMRLCVHFHHHPALSVAVACVIRWQLLCVAGHVATHACSYLMMFVSNYGG